MNKFRRYSISIPRYYGERDSDLKGKPIPDSELTKTINELEEKVRGMTGVSGLKYFPRVPADTSPFEGVWRDIWDIGVIIYIDVPLSEEQNMTNYLRDRKETLAERFGQIEMYIVSWEIEVI